MKKETYVQEGVNLAEGKNAWAKSALDSVYIKKWMRTNDAIIFKLSNKITQVKILWPGTMLIKVMPYHSETNRGVERLNCDVEEKLRAYVSETQTIN